LVVAALTMLRAYCAARKPALGLRPMGSFEGWSGLVRGAIVWAGLPDPVETRGDSDDIDTDAIALADLISGWAELPNGMGSDGCTIAQALDVLRDGAERYHARLRSALGELCPHLH